MMLRRTGWMTIALPAMLLAAPAHAGCVWRDLVDGEVGVATIGAAAPRVHFVAGNHVAPACPAAVPMCRSKAYLVPGDVVVTGTSQRGFTCAGFVGPRGEETVGWLPTAALAPWPALRRAPADWTGRWHVVERDLTIAAAGGGRLRIDGDATWGMGDAHRRANGGIHTGEVHGIARPTNGVVAFTMGDDGTLPFDAGDADACRIRLIRRGPYLLARDSGNCGGLNVNFSGIYRRR